MSSSPVTASGVNAGPSSPILLSVVSVCTKSVPKMVTAFVQCRNGPLCERGAAIVILMPFQLA